MTFVNFFEFADRHHATSTYTSMASQLTTSLRTLRSKEQTSALLDLGVRTDKSTAYDVADLWRGPTPKHVSEMAKLIRSWAASGQRDVQSTDVWRNWWRDMEVRALETAYRLPSVWVFQAFGPEFESHKHGLHVRDFACYDGLHPNHDGRAESMVSDLLWRGLSSGLNAARKLPPTAKYTLSAPLQALPRRVGHVCFTFDAEGWQMLTGEKKTNRKMHEQSMIQTLQAPTILHNDGWNFIMYEPQSRTPFKPGIVANKAGARLSFEVDTSGATNPAVSLQHLESKTGMGIALLECAHCKCKATRIDATGAVSLLSTLVTREVSVSSHKQCKLA